MTDVVQNNGHSWWADHSDNGATWWTGATAAADTAAPTQPPPPPPPPPPAPAAEPTAVVPPVSPAPPAHPTPPAAIQVPPAADPDGDGWVASPPAAAPTTAAVAVAPVAVEPTPKTSWLEGVRARFGEKPKRYRWLTPVALVIIAVVLFVAFTRTLGSAIASGVSSTMTEHDETIVSAVQAVANPAPQQVTVTNVLSWLPCPLTPDAKKAIGYDPPGGPTLDAERAAAVNAQALKWLVDFTPKDLRITAPDATHLVVFVQPITLGVPLIDCTEQNLPEQSTTPTTKAAG